MSDSRWIKCSEKMPEDSEDVLVYDDRNRMSVSCYFTLDKKNYHWEKRDDQIGLGNVTHWMPLPEAPND